jgi:hypothetical protein
MATKTPDPTSSSKLTSIGGNPGKAEMKDHNSATLPIYLKNIKYS